MNYIQGVGTDADRIGVIAMNATEQTALVAALYDRTQLFDRYGSPVPADAKVQAEGGKPFYIRRDKCCRCGGTGIYTRFHGVCYRCGGHGRVDHLDTHVVKLYTVEQNAKLDAAQDKRRAAKEAKAEAALAATTAAFDATYADLLATVPAHWWLTDADALLPKSAAVLLDIVVRGRRFGSLTEKQAAAIPGLVASGLAFEATQKAKAEARATLAASSQFVGAEGQKLVDIAVVCQSVAKFERPAFGSYNGRIEVVSVCTFVDARGFVYVTKTPTFRAEKGETGYLSGTVKAHTEYQGVKQTQLIRPKLVAR